MTEQSFLGMDESNEAKAKQKSNFFSKLFGSKEKDSKNPQDTPVKVNIVSSESEIHYDDWNSNEENSQDYTLNEADIDNIREALGLKSNKKKSAQQEFESISQDKTKTSKKVTKKVKNHAPKEKEELPAFSTENTTSNDSFESQKDSSIKAITTMQKEWSEFSNKKSTVISDPKKISNIDVKKKSRLVREFESSLKREIKKYESRIKREASNTIAKLKNDVLALARRDKHLRARESKLLMHLRKLDEKEAALEEDITKLEAMKSEIQYLADDKKAMDKIVAETKLKLEELKAELASANKELQFVRSRIHNENEDAAMKLKKMHKENQDEELRHKQELKSLTDKIASAKKTLSEMQRKGNQILNQLKTKEDDLKRREDKIAYMLEENKSILTKLEESTKEARPSIPSKDYTSDKKSQRYPTSDPVISLKDKMSDCKHLTETGKLEDAKILYNEIREEFSNISGITEAEKDKLKHDIKEIYDEISLKIMNPPKRSY